MSDRTPLHAFRALLPALRPEYRGMAASYVVGTASALALTALGVLTAWGVGHAVIDGAAPAAGWWIAVATLVVVRTVLTWQEMDVSHAVAYRVLARLRMALFESYARSVPSRRREHSGRAASTAMDDIERLEFFYAHTLAQIGTSATVFVASLVTAFVLLPPSALVLVAGASLIAGTAAVARRVARRRGEEEQHLRSRLSTQVVDALGSLREVLSYKLTDKVVADALVTTELGALAARRRGAVAAFVTGLREAAVAATVIGVILVSSFTIGVSGDEPGAMSRAVLPALVALALAGVSAIADAATTVSQLHPLTASAARVADALHRAPVITPRRRTASLPQGKLGVRFRDVAFTYDDRTAVIEGFSAFIRPGEHVGVAGASGAGKSTLIALAARLWEPASGCIELLDERGGAVPLDAVDEAELRRTVALVDQEATLFHGTVRANLLRGTAPVADERLRDVLELVGAATWADLDHDIGQGGLALSGGQQARLALARALVRQPRVLLVDEVTASLDTETERIVSDVLAGYPGTVLIASHREETLERTDRVLRIGKCSDALASPHSS